MSGGRFHLPGGARRCGLLVAVVGLALGVQRQHLLPPAGVLRSRVAVSVLVGAGRQQPDPSAGGRRSGTLAAVVGR